MLLVFPFYKVVCHTLHVGLKKTKNYLKNIHIGWLYLKRTTRLLLTKNYVCKLYCNGAEEESDLVSCSFLY